MLTLPTRYKRVGSAQSGGMGDVFECHDLHLERRVAVKVLQDNAEGRRILDELRALIVLRSKHVVQLYDIIPSHKGTMGIVEEYISGEDLWDSEVPRKSTDDYLKILWQIACGIADIHEAGIIHRDIKPNNMKLDSEGIVKIFDFGLARNSGEKARTRGFVGTPVYAAPELYGDETVRFTNAVDVFAFGASAIHLALGKLPKPPLQSANQLNSSSLKIPEEIKSILLTCVAASPENRPSMNFVRDELARHLLRNKHRAIAIINGAPSYLNASQPVVRLHLPDISSKTDIGKVNISYDGLRFKVSLSENEVFINNAPAIVGSEIPGSCVVALGASTRRPASRAFVTFDVSNPEVLV